MLREAPVVRDIDISASFSMSMSGDIVDTKDSSDIEDPRFLAILREISGMKIGSSIVLRVRYRNKTQMNPDE